MTYEPMIIPWNPFVSEKNCEIPPRIITTATTRLTIRKESEKSIFGGYGGACGRKLQREEK